LETHLQALVSADSKVCDFLGLPFRLGGDEEGGEGGKKSLGLRISEGTIYICALPAAVIGSLGVVVVLLAIATGLRWSETGQLLCNTPTMIVEGFLLLVLFKAHNLGNIKRRGQVRMALERRGLVGDLLGCTGAPGEANCSSGIGSSGSVASSEMETKMVELKADR
jgi:low-affinity ferrous iron transport protein